MLWLIRRHNSTLFTGMKANSRVYIYPFWLKQTAQRDGTRIIIQNRQLNENCGQTPMSNIRSDTFKCVLMAAGMLFSISL